MYSESSVLLTYFLWQKPRMWFLKRSFSKVSAISKYFLSGSLGTDTTPLYTILAVRIITSCKNYGLLITVTSNSASTDFLDLTLNLKTEPYQPFRKPNNDPIFIDSNSNHSPEILKELPKSISTILS